MGKKNKLEACSHLWKAGSNTVQSSEYIVMMTQQRGCTPAFKTIKIKCWIMKFIIISKQQRTEAQLKIFMFNVEY